MQYFEKIEQEEFSVAIPEAINAELTSHLLRKDKQEDAVFALYKPSHGQSRFTGCIYQIILPNDGDREVHGNVTINPQYFRRACELAVLENSGVVLLHSHLGPGWQTMSKDDIETEHSFSSACITLTDLPLIGLTLGTDGTWSARAWEYREEMYQRKWASTVRVVGKRLNVSYYDKLRPQPQYRNIYKRTMSVWGKENHGKLARLRIGIIGLGSVGSVVAESLARMGMERFVLIDFDEVQEHNLDRLLGATQQDLGALKVNVAQRQIQVAATAAEIEIEASSCSITEEQGYKKALDCDLLFSCVDRPWPRYVLNHLAYNHLIPVIDGGINVRFVQGTTDFEGADWQLQSVGPQRPCLECLGVYNSSDVQVERDGKLDDPSYLSGLPDDHRFKRNENIFPFSTNLASMEIMQFIEQVTGIGNTDYYGTQRYSYNHGYIRLNPDAVCQYGCYFQNGIALADSQFPAPYGHDHSAEQARARQQVYTSQEDHR